MATAAPFYQVWLKVIKEWGSKSTENRPLALSPITSMEMLELENIHDVGGKIR
jgi:hypothetical protein